MRSRRTVLAGIGTLLSGLAGCAGSPESTPREPTASPLPPARQLVPVETPTAADDGTIDVQLGADGRSVRVRRRAPVSDPCHALAVTADRRNRSLVLTESFERTADDDVACPSVLATGGYEQTFDLPSGVSRIVVSHPHGSRYRFRLVAATATSSTRSATVGGPAATPGETASEDGGAEPQDQDS